MKILHPADCPLEKNIEGQRRIDEQACFLNDFAEIAERKATDLIIITGQRRRRLKVRHWRRNHRILGRATV